MRSCTFVWILLLLVQCREDAPEITVQTFELASPQLGVTKNIWVYLPAAYADSDERYPVIYFQDGQWVFEQNPEYSDELHVDETLRKMESGGFEGAIAVGVSSIEDERANEFALYENTRLDAGGKGLQYLRFITETLKPYIDGQYRTKPDRQHTTIAGASLGGLPVVFALTEFPEVFSKGALFSAALHFNKDSILAKVTRKGIRSDVKLYGVVGEGEYNTQVNFVTDNQLLFKSLGKYMPASNLKLEIVPDGEHRIWFWSREFPKAIDFLFTQ